MHPQIRLATTLQWTFPVNKLMQKCHSSPYLLSSLAAWMVVQWERLSWPLPDVIVPLPSHWLQLKKSLSGLLAKEFTQFMPLPLQHLFKCGLTETKEKKITERFLLKTQREQHKNASILVIMEEWKNGENLLQLGENLLIEGVQKVQFLCLVQHNPD